MPRRRSKRLLVPALVVAGLALLIPGCLSPTLPLPPPDPPDSVEAANEPGAWNLRGSVTPGAVVLVKNLNTGVITGTEDDQASGRYFMRVDANQCENGEVWELLGSEVSRSTTFPFVPTVAGVPDLSVCP